MKKIRSAAILLLCLSLLLPVCPAWASNDTVSTLPDFIRAFDHHTSLCEDSFEIQTTEPLIDTLLQKQNGDTSLLGLIAMNCGVIGYSYSHRGSELSISVDGYYAGQRILAAWEGGWTDRLTRREQQTLQAALAIVSSAQGTELERERFLHDALCERITYFTDEEAHNDDDCAIGALLDGRANCDGYADAFFLCLNLAGIPARRIHGKGIEQEDKTEEDSSHMWNLVSVGGLWLMTDVTWNDREDGITYLYYNIGAERASRSYQWRGDALPCAPDALAGDASRPAEIKEISVGSWEAIDTALMNASRRGQPQLALLCDDSLRINSNRERLGKLIYAAGAKDYHWSWSSCGVEIYGIRYEDGFRICSTEQEVIDFINGCAEEQSFSLYFTEELSASLFANDHRGLKQLLAKTRLKQPVSYSYNEESRRVIFDGAAFEAGDARSGFATVHSMSDVKQAVLSLCESRSESMKLAFGDDFDLAARSEELSTLLFSSGIRHFSWSIGNGLVTITDIEYYEYFAFCGSWEEARGWVGVFKEAGVNECQLFITDAELYEKLIPKNRIFDLLDEAGADNAKVSYVNDSQMIIVSFPR